MVAGLVGQTHLLAAWEPPAADWHRGLIYLLPVTLGFAALVGLQGMLWRRKRARAWPDHLEVLHQKLEPGRAVRVVGALLSLAVLLFGIAGMGGWAGVADALATGLSLLVLVHRRWSALLAYLGLVLVTLAVCAGFATVGRLSRGEVGWAHPLQWGCVLSGLAVMTFVWLWLGRFWAQQLYNGRAWTTAGRLIVPARRLGFAVAVIGLFLAARVALWPRLPLVPTEEGGGPGGWAGGVSVALLVLVLVDRARAAHSLGLGACSVVALVIGGAFCWLRF